MAEPRHVGPHADPENTLRVLEQDGAVVVDDFVDNQTLDGLWEDLGPALEAQPECEDWYNGRRTRRVSGLFDRTARLGPVVLHPLYLEPARRLLETPSHMFIGGSRVEVVPKLQISATQLVQIHPGQGAQPLHRDDALHLTRHPGPTTRLQIMVALSDFTPENGATRVILGSHHWDDERAPRTEEAEPAAMRRGSALIWVGGLYHSGGRNDSGTVRTGMTLAFDRGNLRQEENQFLSVSRASLARYPEEIVRMLGYDRCDPGIGWVEMDDPLLALADDEPDRRAA